MTEDQILAGRIKKLVRVRFAVTEPADETNLDRCDGYGILQDVDGRDVFFVDSAAAGRTLRQLEGRPRCPLHRGNRSARSGSESLGRDFLEMMNRPAGRLHRQLGPNHRIQLVLKTGLEIAGLCRWLRRTAAVSLIFPDTDVWLSGSTSG